MHQPSLTPEEATDPRPMLPLSDGGAPLADGGAPGADGGAPGAETDPPVADAGPQGSALPVKGSGKVFCRDLADGAPVETVFLVRDRSRRRKRNGDDFLKLRLGDVTGVVEAVVWDEVEVAWQAATPGEVVRVSGRFEVDRRYGPSLTVRSLRPAAPADYDPEDVLDGPALTYEQMIADLGELVGTIQDPYLRKLLERLLGEGSEVGRRWLVAPAAKHYHQAYRHGLLEHCLSVAQGVSAMAATFPDIDRDLAVTGALLHDIGKIEAYVMDGAAIELSDAGRL
jgi:3'-5' exoribonuclease